MKKWNRFAIEIGKFMNQEIVIRKKDYSAFRSPYFSHAYFRVFVYVLKQKTTFFFNLVSLDIRYFFILLLNLLTYVL